MGAKRRDLTGQRFGRLVAVERNGKDANFKTRWLCRCDCGKLHTVTGTNLTRGNTVSCGCHRLEYHTSHGMSKTKVYSVWCSMIGRCENRSDKAYKNYGARGIKVCERWKKFENFISDMGDRPSNFTIERIDNNGDYTPDNCVWADHHKQSRNKRNNRLYTVNGETKCLTDWAVDAGITYGAALGRLKRGWTIEEVISTPTLRRGKLNGT